MQLFPDQKRIVGLAVPVHDRYEYLRQFYESLRLSDLTGLDYLSVVDDFSHDRKVIDFLPRFRELATDKLKVNIARNSVNLKVHGTLRKALDGLLEAGCTLMGNIDPDSIVNRDWLNALLNLSDKYPGNIYSAFNTLTRNRHRIVSTGSDHYIKNSIGGINKLFSNATYVEVVRPSFVHASQWDCMCCNIIRQYGKKIIVTKPSRIQHIGINSIMGHHDEPDTAQDFRADIAEERKLTSSSTNSRVLETSFSPSR